jgi:hypothetical protein
MEDLLDMLMESFETSVEIKKLADLGAAFFLVGESHTEEDKFE